MDTYINYNYQQIQIPNNYPIYENSINQLQSKYIILSNNNPNNFQPYEIKPYIHNPNEINIMNNIYSFQSTKLTEMNLPLENYYINNNRSTMIKIPEDKNSYIDKIPKDNLKGKHNSSKQKYNFNKINRIKILLNDYELKEKKEKKENQENQEKQPKDNYKKYLNKVEVTKNKVKNKNLNIKININDNNFTEINNNNISYQKNYLKTNENKPKQYNNPIKASKHNSIRTIECIKKNNLISINDTASNNKKNTKSSNLKEIKINHNNNITNMSKQKSTNELRPKINKQKKENKKLDKNYSTNKVSTIKDNERKRSDSNFASLISRKKLKMFSIFKQINNTYEENNNSKIKQERMTIPKNNLANKNKKIQLNTNFGRLYSPQLTSVSQIGNKNQNEIQKKKEIIKRKNTNINVNKEFKRNISYNIDTDISPSDTKKKFSSNTYLTERKIKNLSNQNFFNKKKNVTTKSGGGKIIRKQLSLRDSKYINTEENNKNNNKSYSRNTMRFSRKKIIYSRANNSKEKKEIIVNQKKNLYSFMKKTHKKISHHSQEKLSEDKIDMHNKSYKGFSSIKKLEEIKKKYKFFPHTKEKKNTLKEKNIDYIGESNIFSTLINSMDLTKSNDVMNLNLTEVIPQKTTKHEEEKDEIKILENEEEEKNEENDKDDILNRKSFILDLNNVIPINENQLRDTMNKQPLTKISINTNKI